MFWLPMAMGAVAGAVSDKENPLKGALGGGPVVGAPGGLGGAGVGAGGVVSAAAGAGGLSGAAAGAGGLGGTAGTGLISAGAPAAAANVTSVNGAISGAASGLGSGLGLSPAGAGAANLSAMGGGQGLLSGQGLGASGMGGAQGLMAGGMQAPASAGAGAAGSSFDANLKTANDMAALAERVGVFDKNPTGPQAQSAGIPAKQADFTGLLSAGKGQQMSGAERLLAQRAARKG